MLRLGGRLFERTLAGVRLTAFVETAATSLRHILHVFETAAAELAAARGRHIAAFHTVLPQATGRFHRACPGIELRRDTTTLSPRVKPWLRTRAPWMVVPWMP